MAEEPQRRPTPPSFQEVFRSVSPYLDIGMTFVVAIGAGAWGGAWLDTRYATSPWWLLTGALVGIAVGFYHFLAVVLRK